MTFKVNADIVDIRTDAPQATDKFFVDTNIWFWAGYSNASLSSSNQYNQSNDYPNYLNKVLNTGGMLYKCGLSFAELAHSIERSEFELFKKAKRIKDFRHNYPQQRTSVLAHIEYVWLLADAMTAGNTISVNITDSFVNASLQQLKAQGLDGYDCFMIQAVLTQNITQVITDDSDFGQVVGITVFTANNRLINEAKKQNKLVQR